MIFRYRLTGRDLPLTNPSDDTYDSILFNQDQQTLTDDIVFTIHRWMKTAVTRHHKDQRPKIHSAIKRRVVLVQWASEKRTIPEPLSFHRLRLHITKGIHMGAKKIWKGKFNHDRVTSKVFFGRHELRQLLDWESVHSISRVVSEEHELAWCLACVCGIRPCSLAEVPRRTGQHLR